MVDDLKKVKRELRKRRAKEKISEICSKIKKFWEDHEEDIKKIGPFVLGLLTIIFRFLLRSHKTTKEANLKKLWHYDPRDGEYYKSRRPLSSSEKMRLRELYDSGLSKGEALRKMKLLGR